MPVKVRVRVGYIGSDSNPSSGSISSSGQSQGILSVIVMVLIKKKTRFSSPMSLHNVRLRAEAIPSICGKVVGHPVDVGDRGAPQFVLAPCRLSPNVIAGVPSFGRALLPVNRPIT